MMLIPAFYIQKQFLELGILFFLDPTWPISPTSLAPKLPQSTTI